MVSRRSVRACLIAATLALTLASTIACTGGPGTPSRPTYTEANCIADGFPHAACWSNMLLKPQYTLCLGTQAPPEQILAIIPPIWVEICVDDIVSPWCQQHNVGEPACYNIKVEGRKTGPYETPPFLECAGGLYSCGGGDVDHTGDEDPASSLRHGRWAR